MSGIDLEIEMDKLSSLPVFPPRRRFFDYLPSFLVGWIRHKFSWPKATPREAWAVASLLLRVAYGTHRVAAKIEEIPKPFYLSEVPEPSPDPFGFN